MGGLSLCNSNIVIKVYIALLLATEGKSFPSQGFKSVNCCHLANQTAENKYNDKELN